jgi:hypothetical protein
MTVKQRVRWRAMRASQSAVPRRTLLAGSALALALIAGSCGPVTSLAPAAVFRAHGAASQEAEVWPPRLAYVTETSTSPSKVWLASVNGSEPKLLGPGQQPLLAPNGESVAVSLFGATADSEHGPSIGIYPASGGLLANYLSLETATAVPLAWSPDSRYLAVARQSNGTTSLAAGSGLDVIDTQTGPVTQIAAGTIYGASFARDGSDRLVFGLSHSESFAGGVNVYMSKADGAGLHRLTGDGRSLNPVWGPTYIAYDRERKRRLSPEYQIWLVSGENGATESRLTHIPVGPLVQGLVPLAFSADGSRLLAEFEGQDTTGAYAVTVASGHARSVTVHGQAVIGAGISSDGSTLLLDEGSFMQPPSHGRIVTVPFAGGRPKVLVAHGSQASWNR